MPALCEKSSGREPRDATISGEIRYEGFRDRDGHPLARVDLYVRVLGDEGFTDEWSNRVVSIRRQRVGWDELVRLLRGLGLLADFELDCEFTDYGVPESFEIPDMEARFVCDPREVEAEVGYSRVYRGFEGVSRRR